MQDDDPLFDLPVFTEPQRPPASVPYEVAVRAFEEFAEVLKLREQPRPVERISEFKM